MMTERMIKCELCKLEIDAVMIGSGSVSYLAEVWITQRRHTKGRYFVAHKTGKLAHNSCAEAAFSRGKVIGQLEAFPELGGL